MMNLSKITAYLLLALAAGGSWWLAELLAPSDEKNATQDLGPVDYYSKQLRRTVLDETGQPKETLVAKTLTHYKKGDRAEMEKPVMTLFKQGGKPWIIEAETGTSLPKANIVFMNGEVLISRENERGEKLKIITRNVKYEPGKHYAETAEPTRMLAPDDTLDSKGAQIQFEPSLLIKLLADVRRKHEMR
jgi:lipopolysaccharide export system protein LptC